MNEKTPAKTVIKEINNNNNSDVFEPKESEKFWLQRRKLKSIDIEVGMFTTRLQSDSCIRQSENREIRTILYLCQYYWQYRVITKKINSYGHQNTKGKESLLFYLFQE